MPLCKYYLPEFQYIARAPWPDYDSQLDWVENVTTLEQWLERHVGPHYQRWDWAREQTTSQACVAFKYAKHSTLFLLAWHR